MAGILAFVMIFLLVGCQIPGPDLPREAGQSAAVPPANHEGTPGRLSGQVLFASRTIQAKMADVATAATVSLIHTGNNTTIATTVSDAAGRFMLTFSGGFLPDPAMTYYIEAVKGLKSNLPGNDAARVRTILRFVSGAWASITRNGLTVNPSTTALSIGAALRHGNPAPFDFASLLGTVTTGPPDTYTPVSGLSQADYDNLVSLVRDGLDNDADPVATVGLILPGTWTQLNVGGALSLTGFSPGTAAVGAATTAKGTGFSTTASANVVRFNGVAAAPPTAATKTSLAIAVPAGATSGPTQVQMGNLIALGPSFTVPIVLSGFAPGAGSAGTSVTLSGSGFDMANPAGNAVTIGGAAATVTAVTATSLGVTVPSGAVSGPISVTVAGQVATSASSFVVPVVVDSFAPGFGAAGTAVTITGSGFSKTPGDNRVTFNGVAASVTTASPTSLVVTAPGSTTGPIAVTVAGQVGTSATSYSYLVPSLTAISPALANTGATLALEGAFAGSALVNFPGGVSAAATVLGQNRAQVTVPAGATAGGLTVTTLGVTTAQLPFRRATFGLGLQTFRNAYAQEDSAKAFPRLLTPRFHATSAVIKNYLYVIGGNLSGGAPVIAAASVERARIDGDGSLGSFTVVSGLTAPRGYHGSVVIGNYLYVLEGYGSAGELNNFERAAINADGTLGAFSVVPGANFASGRRAYSTAVIGNYLYVLGGVNAERSVERARIEADGSLGAFATVPGVTLVRGRYQHTSTVVGNKLYVIGGFGAGGAQDSIEQATIAADGALGAFSTVPGNTLAPARFGHATVILGKWLYVVGGYPYNNEGVQRAAINADGSLSAFASVSGVGLIKGRGLVTAALAGNTLYVIGGDNGNVAQAGIEQASVNAGGDVGAFSITASSALINPRGYLSSAVAGKYLYVLGGYNGGWMATVERTEINPDGSLRPFASAPSLVVGRGGPTAAVIGNYLYVLGGYNGDAAEVRIERAPLNDDGSLAGPFAIYAGSTLAQGVYYSRSYVIGSYLYVVSGNSRDGGWNGVQRATINVDGSLGPFAVVSGVAMAPGINGVSGHTGAVLGSYVYVLGGGGSIVNGVQRAPINADGTIGNFVDAGRLARADSPYLGECAVVGNRIYVIGLVGLQAATINTDGSLGAFADLAGINLVTSRHYLATALVGNFLYVLGGQGGTGPLTSIEQSTLP